MNPIERTYKERIERIILPVIESGGMELVDIECLKMVARWLVRIFIDKDGGVTLDDCTAISREVGDLLDVHGIPPAPYTLEVSSPGLDRPLVKDKDYLKYLGHRVKVKTREKVEGVRHFRGRLMEYVDDGSRKILVLHVDGRTYRVPREIVLKANLEYEA